MALLPLEGFTVGITADRRRTEQAELFERRGATVVHGPTIATDYLGAESELVAATRQVIDRRPDVVVATTGIGVRAWFEAAHASGLGHDLLDSLRSAHVVARGPKATAALRLVGLTVSADCGSERLDDCITDLCSRPLAGALVAVQQYGNEDKATTARLQAAGAEVVAVPVYRWRLPHDRRPARRLLAATCDGRVDALTFTSAPALRHLFAMADDDGLADVLRARLGREDPLAACIGPVCADQAVSLGVVSPLVPESSRLGLLVRAVTEALHRRRVELEWRGVNVILQGTALAVGERTVQLTHREGGVLTALVRAGGAVLPKTALLREVWGHSAGDTRAVEVAVGRLRRRLGPEAPQIVAVAGRGYRLDPC